MKAAKKNKEISQSVLNFNAVFIEEADGGYSVSVPSLPGCFSQGDNFEEAVKNIKEAISLYLEEEPEALSKPRREFMAPVTI
ncbi:MAG: type II toxin-antitoxin system HicB family antitoxin [Candidatus Pacebacteria bacterium]|nr:type II toxin-antitoxin system HicB family antitoxin [Candidatus Paceibacterota bacterium]NUQ57278.1 type II toxin-antitoxin system HicB family antitoxin [Candidatus Paceibacter sp.]